jgi:hypothetical protein
VEEAFLAQTYAEGRMAFASLEMNAPRHLGQGENPGVSKAAQSGDPSF